MPLFLADRISQRLGSSARILICGATFKEHVPDIRNSRVVDLHRHFASLGHEVVCTDPFANASEFQKEYGIALVNMDQVPTIGLFDVVVLAVRHDIFQELDFRSLLIPGGLTADLKALWKNRTDTAPEFEYWLL